MNFQLSNTTTVPQAILIRHWHNYFENGQTRRIKNLTYGLMPVDHNAIVRKTLPRKGAEGYRALTVFAELISTATRWPQRGLVVDAQGPIIAERIAGATGMSEPDVRLEPKLIVNKELKCFIHVACHSAHASSPNSDAVACHRQTPALNLEHRVACHISTPTSPNPSTVACLTEGVVIQKEMTTSIGMTGPDVRKGLEPLASKELKGITRVACHKKRIVNRRLPKALKKNSYPLTKNRLRKQELWHATLKAL